MKEGYMTSSYMYGLVHFSPPHFCFVKLLNEKLEKQFLGVFKMIISVP